MQDTNKNHQMKKWIIGFFAIFFTFTAFMLLVVPLALDRESYRMQTVCVKQAIADGVSVANCRYWQGARP